MPSDMREAVARGYWQIWNSPADDYEGGQAVARGYWQIWNSPADDYEGGQFGTWDAPNPDMDEDEVEHHRSVAFTLADAALAVIRERLAEKVPEGDDRNAPVEMSSDEAHGWRAGWNACRAAMLRELGGEG